MAISFPTSLDNFTNPSSGNTLDSPSHSLQHSDINDAVEALEAKLGIGASPAGSATSGQVLTAQGGGTALWATPDYAGSWISYTPTWTRLTVGNGTNTFAYQKYGKLVAIRFSFVMGSTSSMGSDPIFSLPVNCAIYPFSTPFGQVYIEDAGVAGYFGLARYTSQTGILLSLVGSSGSFTTNAGWSSTAPFTWGTNDYFSGQVFYESA